MRMSAQGRAMLRELEGVREGVYFDVVGLPTIGVGHLLTRDEWTSGKIYINGAPVRYDRGITDNVIDALLAQDLRLFELGVDNLVRVPLESYQFDALVSFAFNVGLSAFERSTLLKTLNARDYDAVPAQFARWVYAGGRKISGLARRRIMEIACWNG